MPVDDVGVDGAGAGRDLVAAVVGLAGLAGRTRREAQRPAGVAPGDPQLADGASEKVATMLFRVLTFVPGGGG